MLPASWLPSAATVPAEAPGSGGEASSAAAYESARTSAPPPAADQDSNATRRERAGKAAEERATQQARLGLGNASAVARKQEEAAAQAARGTDGFFGAARASALRADLQRSRAAQSGAMSSGSTPAAPTTAGLPTSGIYAPVLRRCIVSEQLSTFVMRHCSDDENTPCAVYALEAGGGGDCLFHSFAAALEQMILYDTNAKDHVYRKLPMSVFTSDKNTTVAALRAMSAKWLDRCTPEEFLDHVVNWSSDENLGTFPDDWSPTGLLQECGFACLVGCDSVLAFGDAVEGEPGDTSLRVARTDARRGGGEREEPIVLVEQGHSKFAMLREEVKTERAKIGNSHWGDQRDVCALSEALDVGVLMFCDKLQDHGRQCLYNIGCKEREDFPFWIALWWDEPVHFRLAQVSSSRAASSAASGSASAPFRSFWSRDELPAALWQQYRACNRLAT